MAYLPSNSSDETLFDYETVKDVGVELTSKYQSGDPFPHIAIENFLSDELVELCLKRFPNTPDPDSQSYDRNQERFKTSYHPISWSRPSGGSFTRSIRGRL